MKKPEVRNYGRNDACPCLSGLKVKKCCGRTGALGTPEGQVGMLVPYPWVDTESPSIGEIPGKTIVKVQIARIGGPISVVPDHNQPALVYDRNRSPIWERHIPFEQVEEMMKGRLKAFFYSEIKFGQIVFGEEAPWQGW